MMLTVDTNILVRAVLQDDPEQARQADQLMRETAQIAVPLPCLCEFVWVLSRLAKLSRRDIALAIRRLADAYNLVMDREAVAAGLAVLDAGGDFADGVMAFEGSRMGAETFMSFDRKAVTLLQQLGVAAQLVD